MIRKIGSAGISAMIFVLTLFSLSFAQAPAVETHEEKITVTTYYPSPMGVYRKVQLFPSATCEPNSSCNKGARGTLYYCEGTRDVMICDCTPDSEPLPQGVTDRCRWKPAFGWGDDVYWKSVDDVNIFNKNALKDPVTGKDAVDASGNVIYGNVGIGTGGATPASRLTVAGGAKMGFDPGTNDTTLIPTWDTTTCVADKAGTLRYNDNEKNIEYCDGNFWHAFQTLGGSQFSPIGRMDLSGRWQLVATSTRWVGQLTTAKNVTSPFTAFNDNSPTVYDQAGGIIGKVSCVGILGGGSPYNRLHVEFKKFGKNLVNVTWHIDGIMYVGAKDSDHAEDAESDCVLRCNLKGCGATSTSDGLAGGTCSSGGDCGDLDKSDEFSVTIPIDANGVYIAEGTTYTVPYGSSTFEYTGNATVTGGLIGARSSGIQCKKTCNSSSYKGASNMKKWMDVYIDHAWVEVGRAF